MSDEQRRKLSTTDEHVLPEARRFYRLAVQKAHEAIFVAQDGLLRFVNPRTVELLGHSEEDLTARPFTGFIHPEDREMVLSKHFARLRGEDLPARYPFRVVRADGAVLWVELNVARIEWEGRPAALCFLVDSTARLEAERALRESEAAYRQLVEHAPVGLAEFDLGALRFTSVNDVLCDMSGYSRRELLEIDATSLIGAESRTLLESRAARFLEGSPATDAVEYEINTKGGQPLRALVHIRFFKDGSGLPARAALVVHDVTERRRLEEQLLQAQKLEAVGRLAGGIAHDFNNLLTAILGNVEYLLESGQIDPDVLGEIRQAARRASDLTTQLLAFSRKQVQRPYILDLNEVLRGMEAILRRTTRENIDLRLSLSAEPARVKADRIQIEQVALNLVLNARDAIEAAGRITVETTRVRLDEVYADRHPADIVPGRYVMLAVSDTGAGMDPETQARLFEPFFTTKRQGQGTGLGLATVYGIVKQSGGYVWAYSERGRGTTIKAYFPEAEGPPTAAETAAPDSGPVRGGRETVLVVEDEEAIRRLARRILEHWGYSVIVAASAEEALALAARAEGPIDLLLTDVVMPGQSGPELARRLLELRPGLPVLYMSGYTDGALDGLGGLSPGSRLLEKPFTPEDLGRLVRELLDTRR